MPASNTLPVSVVVFMAFVGSASVLFIGGITAMLLTKITIYA